MKAPLYLCFFLIASSTLYAEEVEDAASMLKRHADGSEKLADEQDELSADVQQLVIEQTVQQVIELLSEVEGIMDETTDYLVETETGGITIAAQTEIIEKIHQAAKARQQQGSGGEAGGAMMDMMERMMGKKDGEGEGKGEGKGDKPGDQAGQGQTGESDAANEDNGGNSAGKLEERTVPKAAGKAGKSLPREFQDALDAYNRGLEGKTR
jgi:TolA-binding protein